MKKVTLMLLGLLMALSAAPNLLGQQTGYMQTNLVANKAGVAPKTDPQLNNPWGVASRGGSDPFWTANNNGGNSTTYDQTGTKQSITVTIPVASVNPCPIGCPTGIVANNNAGDFGGAAFIFDTEDGIIAAWTGNPTAVTKVDNSAASAVYKGLAMVSSNSGDFLLAANFRSGQVDVFDKNFQPAALAGSFTDPNLPAGMAPHGIHVINDQVYIAYAAQDGAKHDAVPGASSGVIDIFDDNGNFVKTFASGGTLNAPWGVTIAPATFGTFANATLIGNFGDGTISAFDSTGKALGQITDSGGHLIVNLGLWDILFGANGTGDPNTLYFSAGGANQDTGLFATITPASAATGADFSLALSSQKATVSPGGSTKITVSASAVGGFNSAIALTCTGLPSGVSCALSPSSIMPGGSSSASSTLTLTAAAMPPVGGYGGMGMATLLPFSLLGLFGTVWVGKKNRGKVVKGAARYGLWICVLFVFMLSLGFAVGCGGTSNTSTQGTGQTFTVNVTGTSGALTHTMPITLTIQ